MAVKLVAFETVQGMWERGRGWSLLGRTLAWYRLRRTVVGADEQASYVRQVADSAVKSLIWQFAAIAVVVVLLAVETIFLTHTNVVSRAAFFGSFPGAVALVVFYFFPACVGFSVAQRIEEEGVRGFALFEAIVFAVVCFATTVIAFLLWIHAGMSGF